MWIVGNTSESHARLKNHEGIIFGVKIINFCIEKIQDPENLRLGADPYRESPSKGLTCVIFGLF